jgi:hypothetical protein
MYEVYCFNPVMALLEERFMIENIILCLHYKHIVFKVVSTLFNEYDIFKCILYICIYNNYQQYIFILSKC